MRHANKRKSYIIPAACIGFTLALILGAVTL